MRTDGVIVFKPMLCNGTNLLEIIKQISIQNLFPVGAVEALHISVLCRFAKWAVKQLNILFLWPVLQSLGDQLPTVVHASRYRLHQSASRFFI